MTTTMPGFMFVAITAVLHTEIKKHNLGTKITVKHTCRSNSAGQSASLNGILTIFRKITMKTEPPHGKTNNLHRRKQSRRSAVQ